VRRAPRFSSNQEVRIGARCPVTSALLELRGGHVAEGAGGRTAL
jgi:hypothetical protein